MGRTDLQKLLDEKKSARKHLFDECWPDAAEQMAWEGNQPLVMIFPTKEKSNRDMVYKLLEGLLILHLRVVVVTDDSAGENYKKHAGRILWLNPEGGRMAPVIDEWLTASDMAVVFDEKQATLNTLFDKGVVAIGHAKSPLLQNYNAIEESGNSFTYTEKNTWGVFAALVRACETFHFPYDWQHIIRGILKVR